MHVKVEPSNGVEMSGDLDIESHLFREQLFGYSAVFCSDVSESGSDEDPLSKFSFYEQDIDVDQNTSQVEGTSSNSPLGCRNIKSEPSVEFETNSENLLNFCQDDMDLKFGACSPQEFLNSSEGEEMNCGLSSDCSPSATRSDSPSDVWNLLCSFDVKPEIVPSSYSPPLTPPGLQGKIGNSPVYESPCRKKPSQSGVHGASTPCSRSSHRTVTPPPKRVALAPKMPFQVVTTISAADNGDKGQRPVQIHPKISPVQTSRICNPTSTNNSSKIYVKNGLSSSSSEGSPVFSPLSPSSTSITVTPTSIPTFSLGTRRANSDVTSTVSNNIQAMKRHQRMIKNRESASLSRKKKKEYLNDLEIKVRDLDVENAKLRAENQRLLSRITCLENERAIMKAVRFPSKRASAAVLCVFGFLMVNLLSGSENPSELFVHKESTLGVNGDSSFRYNSRHLLSLDVQKTELYGGMENASIKCSGGRVNSNDNIYENLTKFSKSTIVEGEWSFPLDSAVYSSTPKLRMKNKLKKDPGFNSMMSAIRTKNDTYYLISPENHLLFAAKERNADCAPKLSVVVPSNGQGELMQIDCVVARTKLVKLNDDDRRF